MSIVLIVDSVEGRDALKELVAAAILLPIDGVEEADLPTGDWCSMMAEHVIQMLEARFGND